MAMPDDTNCSMFRGVAMLTVAVVSDVRGAVLARR
jgi:hypothetical protein